MSLVEPYHVVRKDKPKFLKKDDRLSICMAMTDVFGLVQENGIHEEGNYRFVGGCAMDHPIEDVSLYDKMMSTFEEGQRRQRYSIDGHQFFAYKKDVEEDDAKINEVINLLRQHRVVNGMLWGTSAFDRLKANVSPFCFLF